MEASEGCRSHGHPRRISSFQTFSCPRWTVTNSYASFVGIPVPPRSPWFFFSAHYLEREARALATRCGVRHIIQKPAVPTEILRIVDEELGIRKEPPPQAPTEELN